MTLKLFGPYRRNDGRAHVIHYDTETKQRRTQSYPRYLMEQYLDRELAPDEHVDHINNDPTDDRIENYQLLSPGDNTRKSSFRSMMCFVCPVCKTKFEIRTSRYTDNQLKQGKVGPYCSNSCVGKIHH